MQCNSTDYWVGMEVNPDVPGAQLPPIHPDFYEYSAEDREYLSERSTIADIYFGKVVLPYKTYIDETNFDHACVDVILGHQELIVRMIFVCGNWTGKV